MAVTDYYVIYHRLFTSGTYASLCNTCTPIGSPSNTLYMIGEGVGLYYTDHRDSYRSGYRSAGYRAGYKSDTTQRGCSATLSDESRRTAPPLRSVKRRVNRAATDSH